ncbi:hypothetical protein FIBSPDRAFT_931430 [Athelia psychrophila]|uniref:Uncharacterized protein n=1 Tax=Athelia psychrophila TaxID=1759441 RepID=A0A166KE63_9AGAM|nr:hypothetical protein FIBSPDRAFT_931430 [Fibularhizoctonia sp. CBS 109695]
MWSQCSPHVPADFHATAYDPDAFHSYQGEIPQANYPAYADPYTIQGPEVFAPEERRQHPRYRPTAYMLPGGGEDIDNIGANPRSYGYLEKRVYSYCGSLNGTRDLLNSNYHVLNLLLSLWPSEDRVGTWMPDGTYRSRKSSTGTWPVVYITVPT